MNDNDNALDNRPKEIPSGTTTTTETLSTSPVKINFDQTLPTFNIASSQESTRAKIALYFTYFFLGVITLGFLGPFLVSLINPSLVSNPIDASKNLVTEIASVLAGPVGFIVGFYFKQTNSNG